MIFLIHYDRQSSKLVNISEFEDEARDLVSKARIELELSLIGRSGQEVVVLDATSLIALRKSHSRYFSSYQELGSSPKAE